MMELLCISIIKKLLELRSLDPGHEISIFVTTTLEKFRQYLIEKYSPNCDDESLDVSLMVFDDANTSPQRRWRLVGTTAGRNEELWNAGLRYGDGVVGRSAKINKVLHYVRLKGKGRPDDWYVELPGVVNPPDVFMSIPLSFPFVYNDGPTIAVLTVSTDYNSRLIDLCESTEENEMDYKKIEKLAYFPLETILTKMGIERLHLKDFPS